MASPRETECPLCKEDYTLPKFLPCAHVICRHCLLSWLQKDANNSCPICSVSILPPDLHVNSDLQQVIDTFPDDFGMTAVIQSRKILELPHVCDVCDENHTATSFCFACKQRLCPTGTSFHAKCQATKHHLVDPLSELTVERLAEKSHVTCLLHSDWPVERYCPAHKEAMCPLCVDGHGECGKEKVMVMVGEVVDGERQRFKARAARLLDVGAALTNKVNELEQQQQQGEARFSAASSAIMQHFQQLQDALEQRRAELLDAVQREREAFLTAASAALAPLRELNPVVTANGHAADRLARTTPGAHFLNLLRTLEPRLEELERRAEVWDDAGDEGSPSGHGEHHRSKDGEGTGNTSPADGEDCSGNEHGENHGEWVNIRTPRPATASEAGATFTYTSDLSGVKEREEALTRKAASTVRCNADNFVLDEKTVHRVRKDVAFIDFQHGTCHAEPRGALSASCLSGPCVEKTLQSGANPQHCDPTHGEASVTDYCTYAEVSADSKEESYRSRSISLKKSFLRDITKEAAETSQDFSWKLMSSSVPSRLENPSDAPAAEGDACSAISLDDIITASSHKEAEHRQLSAMSRFIASFVTKHTDKNITYTQNADCAKDEVNGSNPDHSCSADTSLTEVKALHSSSRSSLRRERDQHTTSTHDTGSGDKTTKLCLSLDTSLDSSLTAVKTLNSPQPTSRNGESARLHHNSLPACSQATEPSQHPSSCSSSSEETTPKSPDPFVFTAGFSNASARRMAVIHAAGRLEFSYDSARDNWANDTLEASANQRKKKRSKSEDDTPSTLCLFEETEAIHNTIEKSALVNTGFTAISASKVEAKHVVEVGSRVMRGRDWSMFQENVDGGAGGYGHVIRKGSGDRMFGKGWVLVSWHSGRSKWHRMGAEGCFDLILA